MWVTLAPAGVFMLSTGLMLVVRPLWAVRMWTFEVRAMVVVLALLLASFALVLGVVDADVPQIPIDVDGNSAVVRPFGR